MGACIGNFQASGASALAAFLREGEDAVSGANRLPSFIGNPHRRHFDRPAARSHALGGCGREPVPDQDDHQLDRDTVHLVQTFLHAVGRFGEEGEGAGQRFVRERMQIRRDAGSRQKRARSCGELTAVVITREQVPLGVHRHDDRGVAESLLHDLGGSGRASVPAY